MNNQPKIIVAGGGPTGSFTAYNLAKHNINTIVYEEHKEIGEPAHCAGHLSLKSLNQLGLLPLPQTIVENTFHGAVFHSPHGREFSLRFPKAITCTVNRELFDKHLAEMAMNAGAGYSHDSRVESLVIEESTIKGITVTHNDITTTETADLIIDAEGINSRLLRLTNLNPPNPHMIISGVEAQVENVHNIERDMVEVFLGREYASDFYAWLIPLNKDKAKVGLGAKRGNPRQLLSKLMTKHPSASKKLSKAQIVKIAYHPITLGGTLRRMCANGFLAVGDAASQVKPTTGGGVILGLTCAQIAAETIQNAVQDRDFSYIQLSEYERRCRDRLGFDVNIMLRIRKLLNSLSDEKIDEIIRICSKLRFDESLQRISEIDFQGKTLLTIMRDPRSWPILLYFLFTYVAANL
jgi:digeranylgeranylglycerophospholipid reductase